MTGALTKPKRKDPLALTRPSLLPPRARSRTALGLAAMAATGRFALQICSECGGVQYPPRDICGRCLGLDLPFRDLPNGGEILAATTVRVSSDPYFRQRLPWRIAMVRLDCGPSVVAHLHGDCRERGRARLELRLDKSGQPIIFALPEPATPNMQDDPHLRETTMDPKFRRVLVTDGRSPLGQATARALSDAGASIIWVGVARPWQPFAGSDSLAGIPNVEIVSLDVTDMDELEKLASGIGARVDIVVNTADHLRPGGLMAAQSLTAIRNTFDVAVMGLVHLARAFGPVMCARAADGVNNASAWVNVLSVYAQANWPAFGTHSAAQAAALSYAQCLRAEFGRSGIRVVNLFCGPLEGDWREHLPPPKLAPQTVAAAIIDALRRGLEEVAVGDVAADVIERRRADPKALERELANRTE